MKFNFEELISKVSNKKSYLETMQVLANKDWYESDDNREIDYGDEW